MIEIVLCLLGASAMTWIFARSLAWRVERLRTFTDHVLDMNNPDAPLPDESEETAVLNQPCVAAAWQCGSANWWSG